MNPAEQKRKEKKKDKHMKIYHFEKEHCEQIPPLKRAHRERENGHFR